MVYLTLLTFFGLSFQFINSEHTDIILLGSTGDLAQKYLWQGFFNLYEKHSSDHHTFTFYGCGRSPKHSATEKLNKILDKNVICEKKNCVDQKKKFVSLVSYFQLASEIDFKNLGQLLKNSRSVTKYEAITVIFYLSIPPEFYTRTAENIHKFCYSVEENINFRIVFEKPFGYDTNSAIQLQTNLEKYFKEDEIYRIDHYLGKSVVREILPFRFVRQLNPEIEKLLNNKHVERIEVVLKETVDCKGRFSYYNNNGVIRDVLQNHLMEVLLLVTMELEENGVKIPQQKQNLLKNIETPLSVLIGQYEDYLDQSNDEAPDLAEFVPTFAAALLSIESPKWHGVPIIFVSGKSLNERTSYARVIFKNNIFCVSNCPNMNQNQQIIFHIGHGGLPSPMILVSKYFKTVEFPQGFNTEHNLEIKKQIYGKDFSEFFSAVPINDIDAYSSLIQDAFNGRKESFIDGSHLVDSWKIWEDILKYSTERIPRIYENGDEHNVLDFKIFGSSLEYVKNIEKEDASDSFSPNSFLGRKLVTAESETLYKALATDIVSKISQQNTQKFHIAFSGGKSPIRLFQILAALLSDVSLNHVHIWQVDERCVSRESEDSNFHHLLKNFLSNGHISIPDDNIHPMPVSQIKRNCDLESKGNTIYEQSIKNHIANKQFDYIVLGLGADGHTASLFPNEPTLSLKSYVAMTWKSVFRMTLTLPVINRAKQISVLVTGKAKRKILKTLEKSDPGSGLPILRVNPTDGEMTWYIDSNALSLTLN
ncbi:hypothetical protein LOTGIDRAFT_135691 [Lottia gigantea]|uniref:Glucose-6-phosphate 1-dehydrogenase n=1 Tax=Lottia gigantea TaxID=225164 RepID=V4CQH5_LOTGI|nr:hypothetical protein LOTGIDRAFT_135691 [Lottia gigantea]ESP04715.1 hypothetical protein LOTGIDRAFT_135691 [Lottia gigantea]